MRELIHTIKQLFILFDSSPTEGDIVNKLLQISDLLLNNKSTITKNVISNCLESCKEHHKRYNSIISVLPAASNLNVDLGYRILEDMLQMWEVNNYLIGFLQQYEISSLKEKIKIILLGDYHWDAGVSKFLSLQKDQLLCHGYKTICLEGAIPTANITRVQQRLLARLEELEQQNPYGDNILRMNLEKGQIFELQRRLSLTQFNIKFIEPSIDKCSIDKFIKNFKLYSTKFGLREEGMALLILKSAVDSNNGVVAQVGLDHFLPVYKKLRNFHVEIIPIIPFNDFRMVINNPPAKQIVEAQQNLVKMWTSSLQVLHCDRECVKYMGRIEDIETLEQADQYLNFERNDENNIIINRAKMADCFFSWNLENYLHPFDPSLWCAPPSGSRIINGITVVPVINKKPVPII